MLPVLTYPFVDVIEIEPPCPVPRPLLNMYCSTAFTEYALMLNAAPDEFGLVALPEIVPEAMYIAGCRQGQHTTGNHAGARQ